MSPLFRLSCPSFAAYSLYLLSKDVEWFFSLYLLMGNGSLPVALPRYLLFELYLLLTLRTLLVLEDLRVNVNLYFSDEHLP